MHISPIQQNFNNNYSLKSNQNQKQNPAFGKLIIAEEMPVEILKSITKSDEIKKLVKMLHDVGTDLRITRPTFAQYNLDRLAGLHAENGKHHVVIKVFEGFDSKITQEIDSLKNGFAEKTFNEYIEKIKEITVAEALEKNRANYIKDIDSFNATLEPKQTTQTITKAEQAIAKTEHAGATKPKWWQFWKNIEFIW